MAEVLANQGTPEQLPQGAATELNNAAEQGRALGAQADASAPQAPDQAELPAPAQAADYEPQFEPSTDDEDFITGPTTRPDESQLVGTTAPQRVPGHVRAQLPALQAAAQAPGASAELQALVSYLLRSS